MKTIWPILFLFLALFVIVPYVFSQPGPGKTTISGNILIGSKHLDLLPPDGEMGLAIRSTKGNGFPISWLPCDTTANCARMPNGCPYTTRPVYLPVGTYTLSVEIHDKVYRDSGGREGFCKILGYYYKDPAKAQDVHDYKAATKLSITAKKRSFSNIKIVIP
jgi:hypothetical protein